LIPTDDLIYCGREIAMKPEPLFYIKRDGEIVAGPYDLVQMAGLLRRRIITPETLTRQEGDDDWKPFNWQTQFCVARDMAPDAVSTRTEALDEEARGAASGPIPLPSRESILKLCGLAVGVVLGGAVAFVMARLDVTTGTCLELAGAGAMVVAQCLILARLLDEDWMTLGLVLFVPMGDIYYFLSNIWEYFAWFCVKYVGAAVLAGAAVGLAMRSGH
jgi:GYF domain 2